MIPVRTSKCKLHSHYTLIELVAVIFIVGMIGTFAVVQFRKMPAFLSLDSKVSEIKKVMAQARNCAACSGNKTELVFDKEKNLLRVSGYKGKALVQLFEEIKILRNEEELEDEGEKIVLFQFYPDGTGDGNSICLELKKHKVRISLSPLSGMIIAEDVDEK